jgi:DNA-directed RNA polymerase subunit RPC12/RpoP
MIIACPECSNPFEIPADRISPLVQIACPHCAFRMILDFEAANDPSLIEDGMQMASGWLSAAAFHASSAPAAERPRLTAVPQPEPRPQVALAPEPEPEPEPEPSVAAPVRTPATSPPVEPAPQPVVTGARDSETVVTTRPSAASSRAGLQVHLDDSMEAEDAPTTIHTPATMPTAPEPEPAAPPRRPVATPAPRPEPQPPRPSVSGPGVRAVGYDEDEPTRVSVPEEAAPQPPPRGSSTVVARAPEAPRRPPVDEDEPTRLQAPDEPAPRPQQPRFETFDDDLDDLDVPKRSALGTVLVALLLLMALGLVGASVALKQTPDPRPLLEQLFRQYL